MCYKTVLKAKNFKPIPPAHKLRTVKQAGHFVQVPVAKADAPAFVQVGKAA